MKKIIALFMAAAVAALLCACAKKETESTRTCIGMELCNTSATTAVTTQAGGTGLSGDNRFYWNGECANTPDEYACVIKNKTWSASANPVSYSKMIVSKAEMRDEMLDVCVSTEKTEAIWAKFDEAFFEENALVYITLNTVEKPSSLTIVGMEKGKNVDIVVNCIASENIPGDMASYTVLVKLPKASITGDEQLNVYVQ